MIGLPLIMLAVFLVLERHARKAERNPGRRRHHHDRGDDVSADQQTKREQAQLAEQQSQARNARNARLAVVGTLALVAAAVVGLVLAQGGGNDPSSIAAGGLQTGPPPWPSQPVGLSERVEPLAFPPVGDESHHAHALLTIYRNGEQVPVPADIGVGSDNSHTSLHTHTSDGVVHMEADDPYPFRLSHVFQVWGVAFGPDRLGGDIASGINDVHIYVNGEHVDDDVVLKDGDNVVVAYGRAGSFPTEPPADALDNA